MEKFMNKLLRDTDINKKDVQYPLDEHGTNPINYVKDEVYTVANTRYMDSNIIVPEAAPFFAKDIIVKYKKNNSSAIVTLKENIDFTLELLYKGATRAVGQPIYGCIMLNDLELGGVLWVSYRTLGGDQITDRKHVLEKLIEYNRNPRELLWEYVTNTPNLYPPAPHIVDWSELKDLGDLIKTLDDQVKIIGKGFDTLSQNQIDFFNKFDVEKFTRQQKMLDNHSYTDLLNRVSVLERENKEDKQRIAELERQIKLINR